MGDTDVLIIGAGPTGLCLALELALQKIPFRIVEKNPARSNKSRALVIQPRTLELLHRQGSDLSDKLNANGIAGLGARLFVRKRHVTDIPFNDLGFDDTAFSVPFWISQAETESILEEHLNEYGHAVERSISAEKIDQDEAGAEVALKSLNGSETVIRCKYIVGCDGTHSLVRHSANLTFQGSPYVEQFILCDAKLTGSYDRAKISFFLGKRIMLIFPIKGGLVRIIGVRQDQSNNNPPSLAEFQVFVDEMVPGNCVVQDPIWLANFHFHRRGVNSYRSGRLFVAGDAAHIHSPAGGQGMNTGIQDVINLGWKLAAVIRGERGPQLLDTYDTERRPIGDHLLRGTDKLFGFVTSPSPFTVFLRSYIIPVIVPVIMKFRCIKARLFRFIFQFGIRYRRSPDVTTAQIYNGRVMGGDRALDGKIKKDDGTETFLLQLCSPSHHLGILRSKKS
jgi:2-polyprenyl-6-methoxyphenol hydroxylase-like FAD-dependent oxidoreductase